MTVDFHEKERVLLPCVRASGILRINKFYKNSLSVHYVLHMIFIFPGLNQLLFCWVSQISKCHRRCNGQLAFKKEPCGRMERGHRTLEVMLTEGPSGRFARSCAPPPCLGRQCHMVGPRGRMGKQSGLEQGRQRKWWMWVWGRSFSLFKLKGYRFLDPPQDRLHFSCLGSILELEWSWLPREDASHPLGAGLSSCFLINSNWEFFPPLPSPAAGHSSFLLPTWPQPLILEDVPK